MMQSNKTQKKDQLHFWPARETQKLRAVAEEGEQVSEEEQILKQNWR